MMFCLNCFCSTRRDVSLSNLNGVYVDVLSAPANESPTGNWVGSSGLRRGAAGDLGHVDRESALVVLRKPIVRSRVSVKWIVASPNAAQPSWPDRDSVSNAPPTPP